MNLTRKSKLNPDIKITINPKTCVGSYL